MPDIFLPLLATEPVAYAPVVTHAAQPRLRDVQYHAIVFAPGANGGPGAPVAEITPELLNLRWQVAQNLPGMAVFTVVRRNAKLALIEGMRSHVKIWREDARNGLVLVFAGKIAKVLPKATDAVITAWDYKALLQLSRTGYETLYPSKLIGTEIVSPEWGLAKNVDRSPLAFVTTGTIEDPLGTDGLTAIKVGDDFGLTFMNRLFVFYMLAEMAMANTANNVVMDISRTEPHTFSFLKNDGDTVTAIDFTFPGNLIDFDLDRGEELIRNDRATVIDGTNGTEEYAVTDSTSIDAYRRLQDAVSPRTLVGETTGTTETDQTKAIMARLLKEGIRSPKTMLLQVRQDEFTPFSDLSVGDKVRVSLRDEDSGNLYTGTVRVTAFAAAWAPGAGELLQVQARGVET